jgi:hypothetical protein
MSHTAGRRGARLSSARDGWLCLLQSFVRRQSIHNSVHATDDRIDDTARTHKRVACSADKVTPRLGRTLKKPQLVPGNHPAGECSPLFRPVWRRASSKQLLHICLGKTGAHQLTLEKLLRVGRLQSFFQPSFRNHGEALAPTTSSSATAKPFAGALRRLGLLH